MGFFSTVLIIFKASVLDAHKGGACKDDRKWQFILIVGSEQFAGQANQ